MPRYKYAAIDSANRKQTGQVDADSAVQIYSLLSSRGLYCTDCQPVASDSKAVRKVNNKQLALFCRQLSSMLHAGMSMTDALDVIRHKAADAATKQQAGSIYEKLQKGLTFSQALAESDYNYPPIMVSMVASGEASGQMDAVTNDLYEHFSHENKLHNQIINALMYPIILLVITVVIVTFLMTSVLPTFFAMFDSTASLPASTRILMWLSDSLVNYWYLYALAVVALIGLFQLLNKNDEYVLWRDHMKIKWPLFGKLNKTIYTARFARTFASLFKAGIPVVEAMNISAQVLDNRYYSACFAQGVELIRGGQPISAAVEKMGCFDDLLVSMVYTGEQSGELDGVLTSVAAYYDQETETATTRMVTALQPIMIVILGLIICFIMISVIVPIYNMYSSVL